MVPLKVKLSTQDRATQVTCGETRRLSFALQNSPSSVSTRRACSLMKSVSASCWLSGKQTPSSVLCVQSKSFHNLFSIICSHPTLQGEWNFPPNLLSGKVGGSRSAGRNALGSQFCFQVQSENSKRCGHVSVWPVHPISCECSSHRSCHLCTHLFPTSCSVHTGSLQSSMVRIQTAYP